MVFVWTPAEERRLIAECGLDGNRWSVEGTGLQVLLSEALAGLDEALRVHSGNQLCVLYGDSTAGLLGSILGVDIDNVLCLSHENYQ